jgi:hypothetical protein
MLDRRLKTPFTILSSSDAARGAGAAAGARQLVAGWFSTEGSAARVLVLLPGHAPGPVSLRLARFLPRAARGDAGDGLAGTLSAEGSATVVERYELPEGRRYALLGPPHSETTHPSTRAHGTHTCRNTQALSRATCAIATSS